MRDGLGYSYVELISSTLEALTLDGFSIISSLLILLAFLIRAGMSA